MNEHIAAAFGIPSHYFGPVLIRVCLRSPSGSHELHHRFPDNWCQWCGLSEDQIRERAGVSKATAEPEER